MIGRGSEGLAEFLPSFEAGCEYDANELFFGRNDFRVWEIEKRAFGCKYE